MMDNNRVSTETISVIKSSINVTWNDTQTDNKIFAIIEDGISYLDKIAGTQLDYNKGEARRLLSNYCRYAYAGAESEFKNDYAADLTALNFDTQIQARKSEEHG